MATPPLEVVHGAADVIFSAHAPHVRWILIAFLSTGCATMSDRGDDAPTSTSKQVPLTWRTTDTLSDVPVATMTALSSQRLKVFPFTDGRPSPEVIGQNSEEKPVRTVTTKDDVGLYVGTQMASLFHDLATPVVTTDETRVLTGEVAQFFVNEDSTYNANVVLRLTLQDAQERVLWKGVAAGHSRRWGRSFSSENYHEALSNALMEAMKSLIEDQAFVAAFAG